MSAFILLGSVYQASALANPASVKCAADGGTSVIKKDATGNESADCTFSNGAVCEEWAYYRGECSAKAVNTLDQLPSSCTSAYDGCNNCSRSAGGAWACTLRACLVAPTQPAVTCTGYTKTDDKPTMCTKEYMPVCGQLSSTVPVYPAPAPIQKTYSNTCMMKADGATLVSEGACNEIKTHSCPANMVDGGCAVNPRPSFCQVSKIKLQRGSRGKYVTELQEALKQLGVNVQGEKIGKSDGIFGAQLVNGLKYIQGYAGLKQDGVFGKATRDIICSYPTSAVSPMSLR